MSDLNEIDLPDTDRELKLAAWAKAMARIEQIEVIPTDFVTVGHNSRMIRDEVTSILAEYASECGLPVGVNKNASAIK
jgi:hypothetical protein